MKLDKLEKILINIYSKETCYPDCKEQWNIDNKTLGHCAIVALLINDYFGGNICKIKINGISHYFNIINDKIIDFTSDQFKVDKIDYSNYVIKTRDEVLNNEDTNERYQLLKLKVKLNLIDEKIQNCSLCSNMVEKFPNSKTVSFGKQKDVVILGEAPANNGWRKSGIAWYDINHKLLPSGVVLQKLLNLINLTIEDTYFIEAIKCYPIDKKYLNKCSINCKKFLFMQLEEIKPKVILSLGYSATRTILDVKYKRFSDVVGKVFDVNGYKIIPIYHPSPISPLSYKGNEEIFKNLNLQDITNF
jgi:uracil-DNA glycosylase superfamily protein